MTSEIALDARVLPLALAAAGRSERLRNAVFEALREAEADADDPITFREQVRWPLVLALLQEAKKHRVVLDNGLVFEVGPDSRIERALLLSREAHPDHVWEPQTTRLLTALAAEAIHVIVGGAYIGDQVIPLAGALAASHSRGLIHAFEPMAQAFDGLSRNLELNAITNVVAHRMGLWDRSHVRLRLDGPLALASSVAADRRPGEPGEVVESITIDDYVQTRRLTSVGLVMLDTEGGEERALLGATNLLSRPWPGAPHIVFEIHRNFVDWTDGLERTVVVRLLTSRGYTVFAIRDFHSNHRTAGQPIEVIPVDRVYLEGPPHAFNLLATKEPQLVRRLRLRVVANVSPKLLLDRDPALHHPTVGMG